MAMASAASVPCLGASQMSPNDHFAEVAGHGYGLGAL